MDNNNNKKENKKNYFDYENTKVIEHLKGNDAVSYSLICVVLLLIIMIIISSFSPKGFFQSIIQFEALFLLFQLLGGLLQAVTHQGGGYKSRFDRGE